MNKLILTSLQYFLVIFVSGFSLHAAAQAKGYAGGFLGMSVPDYSNTSARPMFGLLGGARLDGEWGVGAFFLGSKNEESSNGQKFDFNYNVYGLEGSFHFEGVADGAYFGVRLGFAKVDWASFNYSPMAWGLHFGYDYFFNPNGSFGVEAGYMAIEKDAGETQDLKAFGLLNFALAGKFWF